MSRDESKLLLSRDTRWYSCSRDWIKIQFDILSHKLDARVIRRNKLQDRIYKYDSVLRLSAPSALYVYAAI